MKGRGASAPLFKKMIYLAGPFFNTAQNAHIKRIELCLAKYGLTYFTPRKSAASKEAKDGGMTPGLAENIFEVNRLQIEATKIMLAILDWKLPLGQHVQLRKAGETLVNLNLPDSGTIWEMGYAHALEVPIFGFRMDQENPLNVMLGRCCTGVISNFGELEVWAQILSKKGVPET